MSASNIIDRAITEQVGARYTTYASGVKNAVVQAEQTSGDVLAAFDRAVENDRNIPSGYGHVVSHVRTKVQEYVASQSEPDEAPATDQREHAAEVLVNYARQRGANMAAVNQTLVQAGIVTPEFDRANAARIVGQAAHQMGLSDQDADALLVEAGLVDPAPEPEPEAQSTESVDPSLFRRLVEFAKGHGFRG